MIIQNEIWLNSSISYVLFDMECVGDRNRQCFNDDWYFQTYTFVFEIIGQGTRFDIVKENCSIKALIIWIKNFALSFNQSRMMVPFTIFHNIFTCTYNNLRTIIRNINDKTRRYEYFIISNYRLIFNLFNYSFASSSYRYFEDHTWNLGVNIRIQYVLKTLKRRHQSFYYSWRKFTLRATIWWIDYVWPLGWIINKSLIKSWKIDASII